jgi:hypothetical protein
MQLASNGQSVDLTGACTALGAYNGTAKLNAKGGWLFEVWADTDSDYYATAFNPGFRPQVCEIQR